MKLYFSKKEKQIITQKKIIDKLTEENECLKEQLFELNPEKVKEKIKLAEISYEEYKKLSKELQYLKTQYSDIIRKSKIELTEIKKENKILKRGE